MEGVSRRRRGGVCVAVVDDEEASTESIQLCGLRLTEHVVEGFAASPRRGRPSRVHHDPATQTSELAVVDDQTAATQSSRCTVPPACRTPAALQRLRTAAPNACNKNVLTFLGRIAVARTYMRPLVTDAVEWSVCRSVNKCSAVAEMGDRLATIDMDLKLGAVPLMRGS